MTSDRKFSLFGVMSVLLLCVAGLLSNLIISKAMADEPLMKLYFLVPFSIETYIPVTMENIEEESYLVWFMQEHKFIHELPKMLQAHPTKREILTAGIRLKADLGTSQGIFFVDRNGIVLRQDSGATFSLSAKELEHLEKRLQSFIGVVDVRAYKRYK